MRFRKTSWLIIACFLAGCNSPRSLSGEYNTYFLSQFKIASLGLSGYEGFASGVKLKLHTDSSFHYSGYDNILIGQWTDRRNDIFLRVDSAFIQIDPVRSNATIPNKAVGFYKDGIIFKKNGNRLKNTRLKRIILLKRNK